MWIHNHLNWTGSSPGHGLLWWPARPAPTAPTGSCGPAAGRSRRGSTSTGWSWWRRPADTAGAQQRAGETSARRFTAEMSKSGREERRENGARGHLLVKIGVEDDQVEVALQALHGALEEVVFGAAPLWWGQKQQHYIETNHFWDFKGRQCLTWRRKSCKK